MADYLRDYLFSLGLSGKERIDTYDFEEALIEIKRHFKTELCDRSPLNFIGASAQDKQTILDYLAEDCRRRKVELMFSDEFYGGPVINIIANNLTRPINFETFQAVKAEKQKIREAEKVPLASYHMAQIEKERTRAKLGQSWWGRVLLKVGVAK